jgi:ABC-type transporter Mla MlaB component
MQITYEEQNLLSITGNITLAKLSELRTEGENIIKELNTPCKITLSNLHNLHIAIISLILAWVRFARLHKKNIQFIEIPAKLLKWLEIINLNTIPEIS